MSKPEPLPLWSYCPLQGRVGSGAGEVPTQILQSSDIHPTYKEYSATTYKLPGRSLPHSLQRQVFTAGKQRTDTPAIVSFCGVLALRSLRPRGEISLEVMICLCWFHRRWKTSLKQQVTPGKATQKRWLAFFW